MLHFFFQAEDGIRGVAVTGVQTCALPICTGSSPSRSRHPCSLSLSAQSVAIAASPAGNAPTAPTTCEPPPTAARSAARSLLRKTHRPRARPLVLQITHHQPHVRRLHDRPVPQPQRLLHVLDRLLAV